MIPKPSGESSLFSASKTFSEAVAGRESVILKNKTISKEPDYHTNEDLFNHSRKIIGFWPIKAKHILSWFDGQYYPTSDEIPKMENERMLATKDFLKCELKWSNDLTFTAKWSQKQNIMWVTFDSESPALALYQRQADLGRNNIRLIRYTPHWVYLRNRELEIQCCLASELDHNLRTQIRLGTSDLILKIKSKGERFYKEVPIDYFGKLPDMDFTNPLSDSISPGLPTGCARFSSEEDEDGFAF